MAKGNNLQYVLLGLLAKQDLTGYDIKKLFAQEVGDFWCARHSQVYPELRKLEESGQITSYTGTVGTKLQKKILPPGPFRPPAASGLADPALGRHDAHPG